MACQLQLLDAIADAEPANLIPWSAQPSPPTDPESVLSRSA